MLLFVLVLFTPTVTHAFDYGPVGNDLFWVALVVWSMGISYMLLKKRDILGSLLRSFTHALLAPGVRHTKKQAHTRNAHIIVEHVAPPPAPKSVETRVLPTHKPSAPTHVHTVPTVHKHAHNTSVPEPVHVLPAVTPAFVRAQSVAAPQASLQTAHSPVTTLVKTPAQPMIHSTHMSHVAHPTPPATQSQSTVTPTTDTLTLEVVAGVPKLILKREVKK